MLLLFRRAMALSGSYRCILAPCQSALCSQIWIGTVEALARCAGVVLRGAWSVWLCLMPIRVSRTNSRLQRMRPCDSTIPT